MNEPNPWQITYGTPIDEWADRISTEFIRIKAERDEAQRLAKDACALVAALALSAGGEIMLPYASAMELPQNAMFEARFENGHLIIRYMR